MIGIPLGLLYGNAIEWFAHRELHRRGKKRTSFWSFHFHEHHNAARKHEMVDDDYLKRLFSGATRRGLDAQTKEALGLIVGGLLHAPLIPVAPFFVATVWFSGYRYYRLHKRAHLDPEWAREHLAWHYDHHMGRNQEKNWCVTHPFFDYVMGTREDYVGTDTERNDIARRAERTARAAATPSERKRGGAWRRGAPPPTCSGRGEGALAPSREW